jgi:hypothetical protein
VLEREGVGIPRFYIRLLANLEDQLVLLKEKVREGRPFHSWDMAPGLQAVRAAFSAPSPCAYLD